ncbi:MAG TPA: hypothetical protein VK586_27060 [Streptosporangiaceae bacterium]|nr:hypothetical protein [Streptosporangiaceae bacterium]
MIGKVIRGDNARRLLYYLYGPGRANEHADPHLVAGFADPGDLEPERRRDGSRDFRRLAGLLEQPLAALAGPGDASPVWHCSLRAAPEDRLLSDAEWAQVAADVMDRAGLAPEGDDLGVRWVAVRHAADHVHLVATLARQDGTRPRTWNDFYRVRDACRDAEQRLGLRCTAPADRTAARCASRAETEQAARRGWDEPPRVTLRREVSVAAGGAGTEQEFFARLQQAGVLVRQRHSTTVPGTVTGYAVGLAEHTSRGGGVIWYGGGKLAADLTVPGLRARWATAGGGPVAGEGLSAAAARAVLRGAVTGAAQRAGDEAGFFAGLRASGVLVRLRFSEADPGQVTGYAVGLAGHPGRDGAPAWYGGGRLAAGLTLPRLRAGWAGGPAGAPGRSGTFRFTAPERDAIYGHAARQAAATAQHIRRCAGTDPGGAADAAWAAGDALHVAARALRSPALSRAADAYDRAARAPHGRVPRRTGEGDGLRAAGRLLALLGSGPGDGTLVSAVLLSGFVALAVAVAELRQAQQHAAQAAAARSAAEHLHASQAQARQAAPQPRPAPGPGRPGAGHGHGTADQDFPAAPVPGAPAPSPHGQAHPGRGAGRGPLPPRRAGPRR